MKNGINFRIGFVFVRSGAATEKKKKYTQNKGRQKNTGTRRQPVAHIFPHGLSAHYFCISKKRHAQNSFF